VFAAVAPFSQYIEDLYALLGDGEFDLLPAVKTLIPGICDWDPSACTDIMEWFMGPSIEMNNSRVPYYLTYEPNPTSVQNVGHWGQEVESGLFQMFNFGEQGNMQHYNQSTPPLYDIGKMPTGLPVAIFSGGRDYLADPTDIATLIKDLPVPPVLHHVSPTYSHMDFLWAENANTEIYPSVLGLLQKYASK